MIIIVRLIIFIFRYILLSQKIHSISLKYSSNSNNNLFILRHVLLSLKTIENRYLLFTKECQKCDKLFSSEVELMAKASAYDTRIARIRSVARSRSRTRTVAFNSTVSEAVAHIKQPCVATDRPRVHNKFAGRKPRKYPPSSPVTCPI